MQLNNETLTEKFNGKSTESRMRIVATEIAKGGYRVKAVRLPPECYASFEELSLPPGRALAGAHDDLLVFLFGRNVSVTARFDSTSAAQFLSDGKAGEPPDVTEVEGFDV